MDWKVHNYTGLELGNSFLGMKHSHFHHPFGLSVEDVFGKGGVDGVGCAWRMLILAFFLSSTERNRLLCTLSFTI